MLLASIRMQMPWPGIEPATLCYASPCNMSTCPRLGGSFSCRGMLYTPGGPGFVQVRNQHIKHSLENQARGLPHKPNLSCSLITDAWSRYNTSHSNWCSGVEKSEGYFREQNLAGSRRHSSRNVPSVAEHSKTKEGHRNEPVECSRCTRFLSVESKAHGQSAWKWPVERTY